jgi:quinol monooxygenase YgiN
MKTVMVRYKTSPKHAEENASLIHAVFDELRARTPGGIRYTSYRLADKVTFVHIATLESADDNPLAKLPAFRAFQAKIEERCVEQPVLTELLPLDSYAPVA